MTRLGRGVTATVVTGVALWGLARLSEVPYAAGGGQGAELRLSWRMRREAEQTCRRLTAEELARLPQHMREEEVCERRVPPYRLRVTVADSLLDERLVVAAGARADRPLAVFAQFAIPPGTHPLRIEFTRESDVAADSTALHRSPGDAPTHLPPPPGPHRLVLDTVLTFPASRVLVVTYDDERQQLRVVVGS
jgi:hypothetical protein